MRTETRPLFASVARCHDLLATSFRSVGRGDSCVVAQFYRLSVHVVVRVTHRNNVPVPVVPELHMGANGCWFCASFDGAVSGPVPRPAVVEPVIFPRAAAAVGGSIARAVNVLHPHLRSHLLSLRLGGSVEVLKQLQVEHFGSSMYPCVRVAVLYVRIEELPFGGCGEQLTKYAFWNIQVFVHPIVAKQDC